MPHPVKTRSDAELAYGKARKSNAKVPVFCIGLQRSLRSAIKVLGYQSGWVPENGLLGL